MPRSMSDRPETPLLDTIHSPADIRALDKEQLPQLCEELRQEVISAVSVTGGHLGAGLGVVPSSTNFLFIDTGRRSDRVAQELHRAGIIVKAWREPGYETYIRASLSTPEDNDVFIRSLTAICVKDKP